MIVPSPNCPDFHQCPQVTCFPLQSKPPFLTEESFGQVHSGWLLWAFPSQHHQEWEELSPDSPHPLCESLMKFVKEKAYKRLGILLWLWPQELLTLRPSGGLQEFNLPVSLYNIWWLLHQVSKCSGPLPAWRWHSTDFNVAVCSVTSFLWKVGKKWIYLSIFFLIVLISMGAVSLQFSASLSRN